MTSPVNGQGGAVALSVVIPTMNKVELLRRTMGALLAQAAGNGRPWEVVVVNDGSTDGTEGFLRELATTSRPAGPTVRTVEPGRNVGRARARNLGARAARGRWILFLDDDIVAPPGLLRAHLDLLEANPGCGAIGHAVTAPEIIDAPHFHYLDSRGAARLGPGPAPGRYFVTQNASVPRDAFLAVGGFDEGFSGYGFEDMEVAFRLEDQAGLRFLALPAPVPVHVHHHTLAEYLAKKRECGRQSLRHIAVLHPGRIAEMHLHHVVDPEGPTGQTPVTRLVRTLAAGPLADVLPRWLEGWPCRAGKRPVWPALYFRLMNLAVLFCFRQGLTETRHD